MNTAIVLLAHGSRDPLWRGPIDAVADEIRRQSPGSTVCCAFLELSEPGLSQAVEALHAQGVQEVRVVPMFLGMGRHAREDLPQQIAALRSQYPSLALEVQAPVGEQVPLTRCLAQLALQKS
jgi:sirohydrochlorin cobaltochelatase